LFHNLPDNTCTPFVSNQVTISEEESPCVSIAVQVRVMGYPATASPEDLMETIRDDDRTTFERESNKCQVYEYF